MIPQDNKPPREFWIYESDTKTDFLFFQTTVSKRDPTTVEDTEDFKDSGTIHLIEYSALTAANEKIDMLESYIDFQLLRTDKVTTYRIKDEANVYYQELAKINSDHIEKLRDELDASRKETMLALNNHIETIGEKFKLQDDNAELARQVSEGHRAIIGTAEKLQVQIKENLMLMDSASALRAAQKAYMANRGNDVLGQIVAAAAAKLDSVLATFSKTSKAIGNE